MTEQWRRPQGRPVRSEKAVARRKRRVRTLEGGTRVELDSVPEAGSRDSFDKRSADWLDVESEEEVREAEVERDRSGMPKPPASPTQRRNRTTERLFIWKEGMWQQCTLVKS